MQPAITLTFATQADLETFIAKQAPQLGFVDVDHLADLRQRIERLEIVIAKVVKTNHDLHKRLSTLEEDGTIDWDGALPEPGEKAA